MIRFSLLNTALAVAVCVGTSACTPVRPVIPPGEVPRASAVSRQELQEGESVREALINQFGEYRSPSAYHRVREVADRLFTQAGTEPGEWRVTLFRGDDIQNAAATQGRQLFVWSGILEQLRSDDLLAVVLAHEIAHVLSGHVTPTKEETINRILAGVAGQAAQRLAGGPEGSSSGEVAGSVATALASGFLVNPYSQRLELEADTVGLFLMSDAGFDPRAAVTLWKELGQTSGVGWEFLSTHPNSASRIDNIEANLPAALERYRSHREYPSSGQH